jgi:hypothetical protein
VLTLNRSDDSVAKEKRDQPLLFVDTSPLHSSSCVLVAAFSGRHAPARVGLNLSAATRPSILFFPTIFWRFFSYYDCDLLASVVCLRLNNVEMDRRRIDPFCQAACARRNDFKRLLAVLDQSSRPRCSSA